MKDAVDSAARWQIYARLLGYARPHWRVFALALIGMIGGAATDPAFAALMKPMLDGSFVAARPADHPLAAGGDGRPVRGAPGVRRSCPISA